MDTQSPFGSKLTLKCTAKYGTISTKSQIVKCIYLFSVFTFRPLLPIRHGRCNLGKNSLLGNFMDGILSTNSNQPCYFFYYTFTNVFYRFDGRINIHVCLESL